MDSEEVSMMTSKLINYTFPTPANNFTAGTTPFNVAGMGGILNAANKLLDTIFPKYDQYLVYSLNVDNMLDFSELNWKKLLVDNKGPIAFIVCALVFGIVLTFAGICWCLKKCCCRDKGCCCRKSDEEVIASKILQKNDKCKRNTCGIFFAALVIMFTFGLVCCFVTNEQMRSNVKKFPRHVDDALSDTQIYLNNSKSQINTLLITNYDQLATNLRESLLRSGEIIKNGLSELTGAQALNNLTDVVETVENVQKSLRAVQNASESLKLKAAQLQSGLTRARNRLLDLLERCQSSRCVELRQTTEIKSLRVENDFQTSLDVYYPKLPNMTDILRELGNFFGTNVRESLDRGKREFDMLSIRIKATVDPYIPSVMETIEQTGDYLESTAKTLTDALDSVPIDDVRDDLVTVEDELHKYSPYWYYTMLFVCITLAFIFSLMTFGIFIGFCGKQPGSEYSNECCSRKTGSSFINCGIFFIFATILSLTIVALVHFIIAGAGGQIICEAINKLDNRTEAALRVPRLRIKNDRNYEVPPYAAILTNCSLDTSAYIAFDLVTAYDIEQIRNLSARFEKKAMSLANRVSLDDDSTKKITFLTPEMKEQINRFARSKITSVRFENFADELTDSVTTVDLNDVIARLNATLSDRDARLISNEIKTELMNEIMFLETLQTRILKPMLNDVKKSAEHLRLLSKDQKDLAVRIRSVAEAAEVAQDALHNIGVTGEVRNLAKKFAEDMVEQVDHYANFTYVMIYEKVGQCGPLFNAFNATVAAVCVNIISPVGGFWLALTFLLVLFIPILISGCVLATQYSKYKSGGYESVNSYVHSARYYSAAYGDGDTIPLSISANARRHGKRGRAGQSEAARYSNRFEDTSHKAWGSQMVFSNHHTPPASGEYERPPPYYYPGPAN